MIDRQITVEGGVRLTSQSCSYEFSKPAAGALLLAIVGRELGDLGRAPLGEVAVEAALHPSLHLMIDMSGLTHVAESVSRDWTAWFQANQHLVRRVDVLAPEPFVRLVVAVSQVFSRTGNLIHIHTKAEPFLALLARAASQSPKHDGPREVRPAPLAV